LCAALEAVEGFEERNEHLLRDVLCGVFLQPSAAGDTIEHGTVLFHDARDRGRITCLQPVQDTCGIRHVAMIRIRPDRAHSGFCNVSAPRDTYPARLVTPQQEDIA